jgi:hypothetical protein
MFVPQHQRIGRPVYRFLSDTESGGDGLLCAISLPGVVCITVADGDTSEVVGKVLGSEGS